ncbi:MAG TPA: hypothetical protein VHB97_19985, partial [Polyangia bacterium]|nr:hypothetical protein [Polyangia bacterium]
AQPMMIDPSKMSGIPRPDGQVPPGTVTVRLIRGQLSNRMIGVDVGLAGADGKVTVQKTDDQGRATFSGLTIGATYQARSTDGVQDLTSQPIELPSSAGVRVMLVFAAKPGEEGGQAAEGGEGAPAGGAPAMPTATNSSDGVAHPDKALPGGTLIVRAVGLGGTPLPDLVVVLGHARQGEGQKGVTEQRAKTNKDGEAKFEGLDAKPTSGYLVEVQKDGARFPSKPFRLQENVGERLSVDVRPVTKDLGALHIGPGSHFIVEVSDDVVQVFEVLRLMNTSPNAVDPGPGGLHFPLPDRALQAQAGPQSSPSLRVVGHEAIWSGPIPPGDTELQIQFMLAYEGGSLDFTQRTPVMFDDSAVVTEKIDGFNVEGQNFTAEEKELQGRKLVLYRGSGTTAGGTLSLHFTGLPHADPTWRYVSLALCLAFVLGFGVYAFGPGTRKKGRVKALADEREQLLGQLVALEQKGGDDAKRAKKREQLTAQLTRIYRELDEVGR